MRYIFIFLLAFAASRSFSLAHPNDGSTVIRNVTVISPSAPYSRTAANVVIRDGRISDVIYGIYLPLVPPKKTIDGTGKFLSPGLIDSHVHLMADAGLREDHAAENPQLVDIFETQEPRSYLHFGFTTLYDLSLSDEKASRWKAQKLSPDLYFCQRLNLAEGYGMAFASPENRYKDPFFIYNPGQEGDVPADVDLSEHTPQAVIAKVKQTGASCIKTYNEDGFAGLWDWPTPNDALVAQLNELAAQAGLAHFHHGNTLGSYAQGAEVGLDVMAHGLWHWDEYNGYLAKHGELPVEIKDMLDVMIAKGVRFQMTAEVLGGEIRIQDEDYLTTDPLIGRALPAELIAWHDTEQGAWLRRVMQNRVKNNPDIVRNMLGSEPNGEVTQASRVGLKRVAAIATYIEKKGGILVLGSDSPSSPGYANPPGLNGYLELLSLERMGIARETILAAATMENARILGLENEIGSIEPGKKADMLLLTKNPLLTMSAYGDIELVIKGGIFYQADMLSAAGEKKQ